MTGPAATSARTEKEKMLAGELYVGSDPDLVADHLRGQAILERFNATPAAAVEERTRLLDQLCGAFGAGSVIRPSFRCDYGANLRIGRNVFVNFDCVFLDCNVITIGDDVQIGPAVQLYTAQHPTDPAQRRALLEYALPITIGENAWIGGGAIVCPGVTIGANSVIGAGSVVTRDIPADVVAVGNPCRVTRR
ncbi:MAG TPA: sugar O-acetyltransferase [Gemmatimonadaceae bacterium]|nr:sugar O-acetyltransferase [Gemmatimonadaceae bacterium]